MHNPRCSRGLGDGCREGRVKVRVRDFRLLERPAAGRTDRMGGLSRWKAPGGGGVGGVCVTLLPSPASGEGVGLHLRKVSAWYGRQGGGGGERIERGGVSHFTPQPAKGSAIQIHVGRPAACPSLDCSLGTKTDNMQSQPLSAAGPGPSLLPDHLSQEK